MICRTYRGEMELIGGGGSQYADGIRLAALVTELRAFVE